MTAPLFQAAWKSPSNIALIKYWGKRPGQIPANASISFTLNNCFTETHLLAFEKENRTKYSIEVLLDDKPESSFIPKIKTFFDHIEAEIPFVSKYHWKIETRNSFPHSSGIASSASGMSALALSLLSIALQMGFKTHDFLKEASFLSRMGSGSACRSVYGGFTEWGRHEDFEGSSDLFAVPLNNIHPVFSDYCDTILLVDEGVKKVSSSIGHQLVNKNIFAAPRFEHARKQASELKKVLKSGDVESFIQIAESEALMLHALMMSSDPYFMLMKPETLSIIERIWDYRKQSPCSFAFTLDAGANVHFIYSKADEKAAHAFVRNELSKFCNQGGVIHDHVGAGPVKIG